MGLLNFLTGRTDMQDDKFKVGQIWNYKTRQGEENSTLTILKIEKDKTIGCIIHICIEGLKIKNPGHSSGISERLPHTPLSQDAIAKSVTQLVSENNELPEFMEGYNLWKQGNGGIFTIEVNEVVEFVEVGLKPADKLAKGYWKTELQTFEGEKIPKDLILDQTAKSTDPDKPAFTSPPKDSKPYYGYPLIKEICFDGFCYGAVTDFLQPDCDEGCRIGDGFVEAPDGTRAGLFWEVRSEMGFSRMGNSDNKRWGIYYFAIPQPIKTVDDMKITFERMVPVLKKMHSEFYSK